MKKITFALVALFIGTVSFAQSLEVKINGVSVDDFLASTNPVNTLPTNVALTFEVTYTNLPTAPGNEQPAGEQARIVVRLYEPNSNPAVFKNALYKNGFTENSATAITETFEYTPTVSHVGHTLQIFGAGAGSTQIQKFEIAVDDAATLSNKDFSIINAAVYPNPTTDKITIATKQEFSSVNIYDVTGKSVRSFNSEKTLDVSTLSKGVYFLKTDTGLTAKFLKN